MRFEKYKIKKPLGDVETHEVFLDRMAQQREEEFGLSEKKIEVKIKEKIIYSIFGIFFIISIIFLVKTFHLQVIKGEELHSLSQSNKGKISLVRPERGIIYDKNLKKLVWNSPAYDLVCDKRNFYTDNNNFLKEIKQITEILNKDFSETINEVIDSDQSDVLIASDINQQELLVLEARISDFPDCRIEKNTIRNYVLGPIFSHVLGYTGRITKRELQSVDGYAINDNIGKDGLENFYEKNLRGTPGQTEIIRDAKGIKRGDEILSEGQAGYSLILNIDADLQKKVYESLEKSIKNIGAKKGAAVALNPKTGAVLSLVSYPAYDDNIFSKGISKEDFNNIVNNPNQPLFNRVISAQYPTGSTIKPFLSSAALQENLISPTKIINDPGYILVQNEYNPDIVYRFSGVKPHGLVNMRKAIAVSSNIYFFTIGGGYGDQPGLGPSRIKKYLDLFGWENKTGIDLPGEFNGFVPSPDWKKRTKNENWWDGDTYNLSIGQSDLQVTPLQVAVAYAVIANGGTLYKPQIVQKIIDTSTGSVQDTLEDQKVIKEFEPEILNSNFINEENLKIVREGMRDCVRKEYGSCFFLNNLSVAVAGKTGTAETNKAGYFNAWSSNFAPYDNPEIVFVVTIEGVEGLRAATLPVAHDVLQYYFQVREGNKK